MNEDNEFLEVPCILCGRNHTQLIANKGHMGLPTYVSICRNDGLVYLTPRWTKARYQRFYSKEYDKYYRPQVFSREADERKYATIKQIWHRVQAQKSHIPTSVLDIGSGMGWSLDFIAKQVGNGISMAAIEASDHCAQHIMENIGAEVLAKAVDADWHENNEGRFDLVIMRHVLEHFLDPFEVLRKVNHVLAPNGIVYIAVPDMMSPKGSLYRYWFRVVHTYYFCNDTLAYIAARAKLEPLMLRSENSEVWALFAKAKEQPDFRIPSVYAQQLEIINSYRRRRFLKDAITFLPQTVFPGLRLRS